MTEADNELARTAAGIGRRALLRGGVLSVAGLAAAALIGCGGDEEGGGDAASAGGGSAPAAQQPAADDPRYPKDPKLPWAFNFPEPAGKTPKAGGTLTVATTWDVSTWDPAKSAAGGTITVPNMIYSRLLRIKGGPEINPFKIVVEPELAKSWERSPDGLTFTFKLQSGVKWQNVAPLNGRALVADDVKFAFERYAKEGVHQSYWVTLDRIEAPDAQTLKITLKKPTPEFEIPIASRYQTIFPRELVDSGEIEKKAVGTGPLILKEATAGDKVVLPRNPDYWRAKVLLDGAEFRVMPDASARVAAFRAKQIDYGYAVVAGKRDVDELLKTIPNLQVNIPVIVNNTLPFSMNLSNPKFTDARVRRGISLAIDRQSILSLVYEGLGKEVSMVLPWTAVFDKEPTEFGPWAKFDLAESKKQLAAAGAEKLEFNYVYYPYAVTYDRISEILVDQFRAAGITMRGGKTDYTSFNSQWVGGKLPEASTTGWAAQGFDANTYFYNHLHSTSPGNRWNLKDKQIDEWAEQQAVELDPQKRREIHRKIWDRDLNEAYRPAMPAGYGFETYQPWVRGLRFGGILGINSSYYDWGEQVESVWLDK
jgi:peptide/nickel transport system substrate-binding protein